MMVYELHNGRLYSVDIRISAPAFGSREQIRVEVETDRIGKITRDKIWRTVNPDGPTGRIVVAQAREQIALRRARKAAEQ